jgi:hypothetical protein
MLREYHDTGLNGTPFYTQHDVNSSDSETLGKISLDKCLPLAEGHASQSFVGRSATFFHFEDKHEVTTLESSFVFAVAQSNPR